MSYIITSKQHVRGLKKPSPAARINPQHPLAQGMDACYVHEGSGIFRNAVLQTRGTALNNPTNTMTPLGVGATYNGTDQASNVGTLAHSLTQLSVVLWTVRTATDEGDYWCDKYTMASDDRVWAIRSSLASYSNEASGATFATNISNTGASSNLRVEHCPYNVSDGNLHSLGFTFTGNVVDLFADGQFRTHYEIAIGTVSSLKNSTAAVGIGAANIDTTPSGHIAATIPLLIVASRVYNPTEIGQLHASPYQFFWEPGRRAIFVPMGEEPGEGQTLAVDVATGTGEAYTPSILASGSASITADTATGTGQAYDITLSGGVVITVDVATGTGEAYAPTITATGAVTVPVATATGTGQAYDPAITATGAATITADTATGTGEAYDVTLSTGQVLAVDAASGTGEAYDPTVTATGSAPFAVGVATGTGEAFAPAIWISGDQTLVVGFATGTGEAYGITLSVPGQDVGGGAGGRGRRRRVDLYPDLRDKLPKQPKKQPRRQVRTQPVEYYDDKPKRGTKPQAPPESPPPRSEPLKGVRLPKKPVESPEVATKESGAPIAVATAQAPVTPAISAAVIPTAVESEQFVGDEEELITLLLLNL